MLRWGIIVVAVALIAIVCFFLRRRWEKLRDQRMQQKWDKEREMKIYEEIKQAELKNEAVRKEWEKTDRGRNILRNGPEDVTASRVFAWLKNNESKQVKLSQKYSDSIPNEIIITIPIPLFSDEVVKWRFLKEGNFNLELPVFGDSKYLHMVKTSDRRMTYTIAWAMEGGDYDWSYNKWEKYPKEKALKIWGTDILDSIDPEKYYSEIWDFQLIGDKED